MNIEATARTATIEQLLTTTVPLFVTPVPSARTLREWLKKANIRGCKSNPLAKRGGGPAYYNVSAVEKYFRGRVK